MLPRSAQKLEMTLVSYSRQRLPRPARLYSTPSKTVNAPVTAFAQVPLPHPDYPPILAQRELPVDESSHLFAMQGFLKRRTPYTILPTPLPDDRVSSLNSFYFTDSPTQDQLAVMDACLHNLYDVPRAKQVFQQLRASKSGESLLESRIYNSFLEAYIDMAYTKEPEDRTLWVEDAYQLYDTMEKGIEKVHPTSSTYAIMLQAWRRFNPESETPVHLSNMPNPTTLLSNLMDREISPTNVVADRVFSSSEEASDIIKLLSKAAVELNFPHVLAELGQAESLGSHVPDPLEDVPEVNPVTRLNTPSEETLDESGNVIPVQTQGEVPFNLSNLRKHLAQVTLARRVLPEDLASRQKLLEESVYDVAVERLRHEAKVFDDLGLGGRELQRADLQKWMWDWHQKLKTRLEAEIKEIIAAEAKIASNKTVPRMGPFLSLVKPEKLSLITILEIMRLQGSGGVTDGMKTARALLTVGRAVENEYKAEMCKRNNIAIPSHARPGEFTGYFTGLGYRDLHARRVTAAKYMEDSEEWTSEWTQLLRVRVGSILVDCLMDTATIERTAVDKRTNEEIKEHQPAFYHAYEYVRGQKLGVIRLNPVVSERIAKDGVRETLHPRHLPMLVKPKPWLSYDQGGYLYNRSAAMRFKDCQEQQTYLDHASALGNVELVYAGLDVLGSTPWKVNRKIFDVVLKVWNSGERLCKVPPAAYDQPEPEKPQNMNDIKAKSVYGTRLKAYMQDRANNHSDRCSVNYKIEIARAFLGDTMYLPHNLDFRGRAYPIPPHFNHIGDDLSRGLLMFAEAQPLGERGLRWLKIHLANLYGFDKGNFDERVKFVMDHLEDVYDSAENPLDGRRWWTKADDPWQCLATCMELHEALESGDPHAFMSYLPVHQDGTCNGLQHYAALGGDVKGAAQVNLSVTDRPSDVYTYVASMVEQLIEEDLKKGDKYAIMLAGRVSRKVVKQTVMTTVYGVTYIGAREQIEKQLKDRKDLPEEECWGASAYLAKKVLSCIGDLFSGAKAIQTWLNLCARLISKSIPADRVPDALQAPSRKKRNGSALTRNRIRKEQMSSVVWTTPLGLPIVQPYRKTKRKQVMTAIQSVFISDPNAPAEVNAVKQASAFPPNFIHSLDATHMMLTALECRTQGLTFASVHDSYWTHASSIDKMSEIIRDTFIALHSSDVLGKLATEFRTRYASHKVPLASLRIGKLLKNLEGAGVRIVTSSEQAAALHEDGCTSFDNIMDVSDVEAGSIAQISTSPEDSKTTEISQKVKVPKPKRGRPFKNAAMIQGEIASLADEAGEDGAGDEDTDSPLSNKFVDLSAVLPPLPKKGDFDVETIKKSQYFFS
ncbi:DNA/RNA polymerase [Rhizopogon vinicolor AM-OR11-026]|uniref:DNA-directed RNA polymerase n=1 Tax=Rhizopogon vinicolor AM-OR11-026 TaxID=1314800 RepID=A0A1B7NHM6_9AGAM|nr:DNA/RNA polymerase [Rhizopogon vinicolor AM-OR11-026]